VDCRAFDEQLVRRDPRVAGLMDRFVCVRVVQANAMELALFRFDYDLTFAAFFLNADRTIYGRYGSRSDRKDATKDMSMEGFRAALESALDLHKKYPSNKALLAGKQGGPTRFKSPEEFPSLAGKYKPTLDYEGKVVQSCMHCHQVHDAERRLFRDDRKPIPDNVLYPWPMPHTVGLKLDPREKATVTEVVPGSAADLGGFKTGDEIQTVERQPILSIADVQWVLHNASQPATLKAQVFRGRRQLDLTLDLGAGWRRQSDIGWRVTTWDLRRMAAGGLVLDELTAEERTNAKLSDKVLALRVKHVGQYGEHAAAKRAGFKEDDILVTVAGDSARLTENDLLARLVQTRMPGEKVAMTVLRAGERVELELPMQ
jgi:serine protease Do